MSPVKGILIALDQLLNALLWFLPGGAFPDETLSARCWRMEHKQPFTALRPIVDGLFFWQKNHCEQSFYAEIKRRHSPKEER